MSDAPPSPSPVVPPDPAPVGPEASADALPVVCASCGADRSGPYCAACGQRHLDGRLTLRGLWSDFVSRAFSLDRGLLHTLAALARGPGRVPADYVAGRQRAYTHPLSFYLLVAALSLLSASAYQAQLIDEVGESGGGLIQIEGSATEEGTTGARLQAAAERLDGDDGRGVMRRVTEIQNRVATPMLVVFALLVVGPLRLVFGRRRNLAETAIFALYAVGFATLVLAVVSPLLFLALPVTTASLVQSGLTLLAYAGIGAWGAVAFWAPGWRTVAKAAGAGLLGYVLYALLLGGVSLALLADELIESAGLTWGEVLG